MDAGIADTLNRRVVQLIAGQLDAVDAELGCRVIPPWYRSPIADTLMGDGPQPASDRAWLVGVLAARTPGCDFDGQPADCDWDNLFTHFRAEILARRDPKSHPACAAEIPARDGVGSR